MQSRISLKKVNLHYSSLAFRENSLKAYVFKKFTKKQNKVRQDIHALKDIDITISPGERVALLGHNGAGKSTLLKTVAGLYPISSGERIVNGRIRALFELSTGFESEATGRENIMYRGLMLGKKPKEIRQVEEAIVDFSELKEFIDYPIKTYSAGMLVRLAFAISTIIEGDILLLDEVLGAGDVAFMAKAKARITQLIAKAEIMLLASHDFSAMKQLCSRALVLDHGTLVYDGNVDDAIQHYKTIMKVV